MFIETIAPESATGRLAEVYASIARHHGQVTNIWQIASLDADLLQAHLDMNVATMLRPDWLSPLECHSIALTVCSANECLYGLHHHTEAVLQAGGSADLVEALVAGEDPDTEPVRLRRLVYFARKLTLLPNSMSRRDVDHLRGAGLSDVEILRTVHTAAYLNYTARLGVALGVQLEGDAA
ncbi:MAG: peroxidase-related enzyme [bacterium]|nr:peroxidase-related enzyme [bacterium]